MKNTFFVAFVVASTLHLSVSKRYTGKFNQSDYKADVGLEGHLIKATKAHNALECFSQCVVDCRCKSYQTNDSHCELLSETNITVPSSFKPKPGYKYFELKQSIKQEESTARVCSNGCCSQKLCLNGGTCIEQCKDVNLKFTCECKTGFGGHFCQIPSSCDKLPRGSPSGRYTLMNPPNFLRVYCDFTEPRFVWTLIESFAFAAGTRGNYFYKPFSVDFPRGETNLDWTDYRMSLTNMRHIEKHSTHWRATCKFDSEGLKYDDYIRVKKSEQGLLQEIHEKCIRYEFISARNISCKNCTGHIRNYQYHAFVDGTNGKKLSPPCEWDGTPGAVIVNQNRYPDGEELFGIYDVYNPRHRCSSTDTATTNWWLGKRVQSLLNENYKLTEKRSEL